MNDIRDLLPGRMRERTFQLKARRDAGAVILDLDPDAFGRWYGPQQIGRAHV